jgi:hypothetical protein
MEIFFDRNPELLNLKQGFIVSLANSQRTIDLFFVMEQNPNFLIDTLKNVKDCCGRYSRIGGIYIRSCRLVVEFSTSRKYFRLNFVSSFHHISETQRRQFFLVEDRTWEELELKTSLQYFARSETILHWNFEERVDITGLLQCKNVPIPNICIDFDGIKYRIGDVAKIVSFRVDDEGYWTDSIQGWKYSHVHDEFEQFRKGPVNILRKNGKYAPIFTTVKRILTGLNSVSQTCNHPDNDIAIFKSRNKGKYDVSHLAGGTTWQQSVNTYCHAIFELPEEDIPGPITKILNTRKDKKSPKKLLRWKSSKKFKVDYFAEME